MRTLSNEFPNNRRIAFVLTLVLSVALSGKAAAQWATSGSDIYSTNSGNVGVGTTTPGLKLDVAGANTIRATRTIANWTGGAAQAGLTLNAKLTTQQLSNGVGASVLFQIEDFDTPANIIGRIGAVRDGGDAIGKMVFRLGSGSGEVDRLTLSNTSMTATVPIYANYSADLAEWATVRGSMDPGTVVVIYKSGVNEVTPSSRRYDTSVAGVISGKPAIVLGEAGESKATVATTGRVKVKAVASNGPIHTGDLLVTSDREGYAMRSEAVAVGGIEMHRPGTLIGKALEPLDEGEGELLVLLSLQ